MKISLCFVLLMLVCCQLGVSYACTKICGNYWEGVNIHSYGAYNAPLQGTLWKDQCFTYTGQQVFRDGYTWKQIYYGSVLGWVAAEVCYTRAC